MYIHVYSSLCTYHLHTMCAFALDSAVNREVAGFRLPSRSTGPLQVLRPPPAPLADALLRGAGCAEECCAWRGPRRPDGSQECRRWRCTSAPPQRCKRQDRLTGSTSNSVPQVLNWPLKLELEMVCSIQFSSSWAAIV